MATTLTSTNYNGSVSETLYKVLGVGNEVIEKQSAFLVTDVNSKKELPYLAQDADPIGAYEKTPTGTTTNTAYTKRDLTVSDVMIYETFCPKDFIELWSKWQSVGSMTELNLNPELLASILDVTANGAGTHLAKLFWQGDTASGTPALTRFDGIVKQLLADASVIDVVTLGAITKANVIDVTEAVWAAIPSKFFDDADYKIHMSTTDYKFLQQANLDAKKTTTGVLSENIERLFLEKRIVHFSGLAAGSIVGAKSSLAEQSNLVFGFWFDPENEFQDARVGRVAANSDDWFIRVNMKAGAQYRYGGDIVLYQPA